MIRLACAAAVLALLPAAHAGTLTEGPAAQALAQAHRAAAAAAEAPSPDSFDGRCQQAVDAAAQAMARDDDGASGSWETVSAVRSRQRERAGMDGDDPTKAFGDLARATVQAVPGMGSDLSWIGSSWQPWQLGRSGEALEGLGSVFELDASGVNTGMARGPEADDGWATRAPDASGYGWVLLCALPALLLAPRQKPEPSHRAR